MTQHRRLLFDVLSGKHTDRTPFFPDITDWYGYHRTRRGEPRACEPGELVFDDNLIHREPGTIPPPYDEMTLLDIYRDNDWGFFAHVYDWYEETYDRSVVMSDITDGHDRSISFRTPVGEVSRRFSLASDGTWTPRDYFAESLNDLRVLRYIIEATRFEPHFECAQRVLDTLGEGGAADMVIFYSPFGRLVHEYLGFERAIYACVDEPDIVDTFLELRDKKDMELVELACESPGRLVILSDHPDEYLISPAYYQRYCIPFYRRACEKLHGSGKYVSNHLDGNFRGYFPMLGKTGFDYLDGCTPSPMFNYTVEKLAEALPETMSAFCGVPSTLFCGTADIKDITDYAERIINALSGRVIVNVGDILPPLGDIELVRGLGRYIGALTGS